MTKRDVLVKAVALDVFTDEEKGVLQKMIDGLDKRSSKPTKAQKENVGVKNDILAVLADGKARTAKVSALLRACVLDGKVEKIPGAKSKDAPTYVAVDGATPYEV